VLPFLNNAMWMSHLYAQPLNAPLFYGPFTTDPELYTPDCLNGFDSWMGVGQLLITPTLFEGMLQREVYFPKAGDDDAALYFDLHLPCKSYRAGSRATVSTPLDHFGMFAREGAVIPVGKPAVTVTARSGPPIVHGDGVEAVLKGDGGVVELDDWRGVQLFPAREGSYRGSWIEDDGISVDPAKCVIEVDYRATPTSVTVSFKVLEDAFSPLWGWHLDVILPVGDARKVIQASKRDGEKAAIENQWQGRPCWRVTIQ